jgi:hypothetical protein
MRRASLLLALVPVGCFAASSGGGSPDANFNMQMDAEFTDSGSGVDSAVDASVDSSTSDVTVEAAVDAPVEASGPQPVTVLVTNATGAEEGVGVVFTDMNAMTLPLQTTGATGATSNLMAAGGQVTVLMGTAATPYLFTVEGVAAGDTIAVYDPSLDATATTDQVSIDSWPDGGPPSVYEYQAAIGPCTTQSDQPPLVMNLRAGCEAFGHFPVLLTALDANEDPIGYTWQDSVAVPADGGSALVDVNLTNPWTTAVDSFTITAFGEGQPYNGTIAFSLLADGVGTRVSVAENEIGMNVGDAGLSQTFPYPPGYASAIQGEVGVENIQYGNGQGAFITSMATRVADAGATSTDLGQLLPMLVSATIDTTSVAQPVVAWTVSDAGSVGGANGVVVTTNWTSNGVTGIWTIVAPPTATSVTAPALPASATAWTPASNAIFFQPPTVAVVQATFFPGYAGLRAQAGTAGLTSVLLSYRTSGSGGYFNGPIAPPLSANGTLLMTAVTAPGD